MNIKTFTSGLFKTNIYLLENLGSYILIDPGYLSDELTNYIVDNNIKLDSILLTHGHFDHIGGVDFYQKFLNGKVYLGINDFEMISDSKINGSYQFSKNNVSLNTLVESIENKKIKIKNFNLNFIPLPGHSPGSYGFLIDNYFFTGDVIFFSAWGRTDFYKGSFESLKKSIEYIKSFNKDIIIKPGHGKEFKIKEITWI